jgi:hypothetical protein
MEIWKKLELYPLYEVSSHGRIRSIDRKKGLDGSKQNRSGRLLKPGIDKRGYMKISLDSEHGRKTLKVHRLVASSFFDALENESLYEVNHKDRNKVNNHIENLEWVSPSENVEHYAREVRARIFAADNPANFNQKLYLSEVEAIVEGISDGFTSKSIASFYKVSLPSIKSIRVGRTWSFFTGIKRSTIK